MNTPTQEHLRLAYTQGNEAARQIDNRIWVIYGLYFPLVGGAIALLKDVKSLWLEVLILAGVALASVSQIALAGHLQRASDHVFARLRTIEESLNIEFHRTFPAPPSKHLWRPQKWLSGVGARGVMQLWAMGVAAWALVSASFFFGDAAETATRAFVLLVLLAAAISWLRLWLRKRRDSTETH